MLLKMGDLMHIFLKVFVPKGANWFESMSVKELYKIASYYGIIWSSRTIGTQHCLIRAVILSQVYDYSTCCFC